MKQALTKDTYGVHISIYHKEYNYYVISYSMQAKNQKAEIWYMEWCFVLLTLRLSEIVSPILDINVCGDIEKNPLQHIVSQSGCELVVIMVVAVDLSFLLVGG